MSGISLPPISDIDPLTGGLPTEIEPANPPPIELVLVSTGMVSIPPINGGAVEAYVVDVARMFSHRRGYHVSVISNHRSPTRLGWENDTAWIATHSPIDSFPLRPAPSALAHLVGGSISAAVAYRHLDRLPRRDHVIVHMNEEISAITFSQLGGRVGRVFTVHNPPPATGDRGYGGFEYAIRRANARATWRFALRRMDAVVALTGWMRRFLVDEWQLEPDKVHVLPLPVDTEAYRPPPPNREEPARAGPLHLLFVGRLEPRKNVLTAVEALRYLPPDTLLTVVGDGPMASVTAKRARELGVEKRVHLIDRIPVDGLVDLYRHATMLVHPSLLESYARVVVEAAACGLPAVLPDSPMFQDFFDGKGAFGYAPSEGPAGLAGEVMRLWEDPARLRQARSVAREFALRNNSYASFSDRLARIYTAAAP
ncbi:MAG: glycosyltransferase family 4 protein [Thermoplasmata archaeon]|nr:glycosyltransferase family 4 protein [Thermoplasmata archaeon]